jgi:hypothetical protein
MVSEGRPNSAVFILSAVAAVLVAPICEEITFRLLLQGWLEKREAALRGILEKNPDVGPPEVDTAMPNAPEATLKDHFYNISGNTTSSTEDAETETLSPQSPCRPIVATPHGWFSITISAALFGVAHFGYGPEPIPLFFLGLVLGYLYNRTHRIVPSMIAHAVFNGYSMIALWRLVFFDAG